MEKEPTKEKNIIHRFLTKKLSEADFEILDKKMQDEHFLEAVSDALVKTYGKAEERKVLKGAIQKTHQKMMVTKKKNALIRTILSIIVLVIILGIACFYYWQKNTVAPLNDSVVIYATYFEPYPDLFNQLGTAENHTSAIDAAFQSYNKENYKVAIDAFRAVMNETKNTDLTTHFYYSMALLANQQSEEAIAVLSTIVAESSFQLKEEAHWYLGLAYCQTDQPKKAKEIFQKMMKERFVFKRSAVKEILEGID